jgi:hypothetical protein
MKFNDLGIDNIMTKDTELEAITFLSKELTIPN